MEQLSLEQQFESIPLDGIKGILVDIDNTLYAYEPAHAHALHATYNAFIQDFPGGDFHTYKAIYNQARTRVGIDNNGLASSHSRLLYFQKVFEIHTGKTQPALSLKYEELYWSSFFEKMDLLPAANSFLGRCTEMGLPICAITDLTTQIQLKKVLHLGLDRYLQFMVSSEEAGVEKPHPYIFKLALEKLNLQPNEVIMVGDSEAKDIVGARQLGITPYLINPQV